MHYRKVPITWASNDWRYRFCQNASPVACWGGPQPPGLPAAVERAKGAAFFSLRSLFPRICAESTSAGYFKKRTASIPLNRAGFRCCACTMLSRSKSEGYFSKPKLTIFNALQFSETVRTVSCENPSDVCAATSSESSTAQFFDAYK